MNSPPVGGLTFLSPLRRVSGSRNTRVRNDLQKIVEEKLFPSSSPPTLLYSRFFPGDSPPGPGWPVFCLMFHCKRLFGRLNVPLKVFVYLDRPPLFPDVPQPFLVAILSPPFPPTHQASSPTVKICV